MGATLHTDWEWLPSVPLDLAHLNPGHDPEACASRPSRTGDPELLLVSKRPLSASIYWSIEPQTY